MLYAAVADHEGEPTQQRVAGRSKGGQAHGPSQHECLVGEDGKGQVQAGNKFLLVGG